MKIQADSLPVGNVAGRKAKKGNSTRKAKKTRSTLRYFEVKIRIPAEEYARGQAYFAEKKYLLELGGGDGKTREA
jgi:hypothetical protein